MPETYAGYTVPTYADPADAPKAFKDLVDDINANLTSAIQGGVPAGTIVAYAGATAPTGWLLCDGSAVSRSTYAALFAAIGTSYGAGNNSSTFNVPSFQGRVPVGRNAGDTDFGNLGNTGGVKEVTLTEQQLAAHSHGDGTLTAASGGTHTHNIPTQGTISSAAHNHAEAGVISQAGQGFGGATDGATGSTGSAHGHDVTGSTSPAGGGQAHTNLQPYAVVNYIIRT